MSFLKLRKVNASLQGNVDIKLMKSHRMLEPIKADIIVKLSAKIVEVWKRKLPGDLNNDMNAFVRKTGALLTEVNSKIF